jgi:hypothetical protein
MPRESNEATVVPASAAGACKQTTTGGAACSHEAYGMNDTTQWCQLEMLQIPGWV